MGAGIVGICISLASSVLPLFIFVFWLIGSTGEKLLDRLYYNAVYPNLPSTKRKEKALEEKLKLQQEEEEREAIEKGNYRTELVARMIKRDDFDFGFVPRPSKLRELRKRHPDLADKIADPDYFATDEFLEEAEFYWRHNRNFYARRNYEEWLNE